MDSNFYGTDKFVFEESYISDVKKITTAENMKLATNWP
jgi:hypothetical protein